jgi:hypothetical protein
MRWLANLNQGRTHFPCDSRSSYEYAIHCQYQYSLACSMVTWDPLTMLIVEVNMIIICRLRNSISFNMCFIILVLGVKQTIYH